MLIHNTIHMSKHFFRVRPIFSNINYRFIIFAVFNLIFTRYTKIKILEYCIIYFYCFFVYCFFVYFKIRHFFYKRNTTRICINNRIKIIFFTKFLYNIQEFNLGANRRIVNFTSLIVYILYICR